jgi:hypothetical protein
MVQEGAEPVMVDIPSAPDTEAQLANERAPSAAKRTRDALEWTLMSWMHTALNLIS